MRDYASISKRLRRYSENCVAYKLDADFADAVSDAADAIEELLAAVPHWISVEERLPEIERIVLLFNGAVHIGWRVDGKRFRFLSDRYPDHPTHWMPLPAPPKEDAE